MGMRVNAGQGTITATEGAMWVHSKKIVGTDVKNCGGNIGNFRV